MFGRLVTLKSNGSIRDDLLAIRTDHDMGDRSSCLLQLSAIHGVADEGTLLDRLVIKRWRHAREAELVSCHDLKDSGMVQPLSRIGSAAYVHGRICLVDLNSCDTNLFRRDAST